MTMCVNQYGPTQRQVYRMSRPEVHLLDHLGGVVEKGRGRERGHGGGARCLGMGLESGEGRECTWDTRAAKRPAEA